LPASTFKDDLRDLINKHSLEGASGTPDFILADLLVEVLSAFNQTMRKREDFYRNDAKPDPDPSVIPNAPDLKVETQWVPLSYKTTEEARKLVNRLYSDLCYQAPEQWSSEVVRENITDTLEALKKLLGCETE
jgi:hypothetical protein